MEASRSANWTGMALLAAANTTMMPTAAVLVPAANCSVEVEPSCRLPRRIRQTFSLLE